MSTKSFDALMASVSSDWSQEAKDIHSAASTAFSSELSERAEIGSLLANARLSLKMSQGDVAKKSGIQQAEVSRIERGLSNPTIETLSKALKSVGLRLTASPT